MLQSPDLACLQFQKYKLDAKGKPLFVKMKDGKAVPQLEPEPYERIVCTGKEVLQYSWDDQKIFVFPLDKQAAAEGPPARPAPLPLQYEGGGGQEAVRDDAARSRTRRNT